MPRSTTLLREADGSCVRRTVLPEGLRIVSERVPGVRSVSLGVWVSVGSRDETARQWGAAHYLEHLLFKGTARRTALEISAAIDAVGGEINAFTGKEYTCFYARVLDDDLALATDVVCDVVTNALMERRDVEGERGVILEEIAMRDDDPSDLIHDEFGTVMFGDGPLGRSILGTVDTIEGIGREAIASFYRRHYRPDRILVAASGNLDHATVVRQVTKALRQSGFLDGQEREPAQTPRRRARARTGGRLVIARGTEQAHVVLGVPSIERTDPRRYALGVMNAALGGGMSSRLFQSVREQRGLAYSVYSFTTQYADAGFLGLYAGCQPGRIDEVLDVSRAVLADLHRHGITAEELQRGKGQLRGSMVLGQEDTGARMTRIAKAELLYGDMPSIDEILRRIDAVSLDDIAALCADLLGTEPALAVIGPYDDPGRFAA